MTPEAKRLRQAMVASFEPFVRRRLADLGLGASSRIDDAIEAGQRWLDAELDALLSLPMHLQRRGPLELFQEAMRFPTAALTAAGVTPTDRDPVSDRALPGDPYDLAPSSSQMLGDEAWRAHIAWGRSKAMALAGSVLPDADPEKTRAPTVMLVSSNLMDRSKTEAAAGRAGYAHVVARNPAAVESSLAHDAPALAFVDLQHPAADQALRAAVGAGVRVVAFGPHVDDIAITRAATLGAEAMPRSRFFRTLDALIPPIV